MTISTQQALQSLYVSGANSTINYTKFISSGVPDVVFYVSSSAENFYLDIVPTSSAEKIVFYRNNDAQITEQNKLRLSPNSFLVPIIAKIDASNFNNVTDQRKSYDILINLTAVEIVEPPAGSGGDGCAIPCTQVDPDDETNSARGVCPEGYSCVLGCCVILEQ